METEISFEVTSSSKFKNEDEKSLKTGTLFSAGTPISGSVNFEISKSSTHTYGEEESNSFTFTEKLQCDAPAFTEKECKLLIK